MAQTNSPNNSNDRQRQLAREKMAFRYSNALARRDFGVVAAICEAASSDPILAEMIRGIDEVYAAETSATAHPQPHHAFSNGRVSHGQPKSQPAMRPTSTIPAPRLSLPAQSRERRSSLGVSLLVLVALTILFGVFLITLSQNKTDNPAAATQAAASTSTPSPAPTMIQMLPTPATPTITVNSLTDDNSGCPANCTLRSAIASAKDGDVIGFSANLKGAIKISSVIPIARSIRIIGPGSEILTIDGNEETGIFSIDGGKVIISGLTLFNGRANEGASIGVESTAALTLVDCLVSNNVSNGMGGGIVNRGILVVDRVAFFQNSAGSSGGGIVSSGNSKLTISNSTFEDNSASTVGGAIASSESATVEIVNSTFVDNSASTTGGAISITGGSLTIISSTISENSAGATGGGVIAQQTSAFSLKSTIIAENTAGISSPDVAGKVTSNGFNLIGDANGATGLLASDQQNIVAMLDVLKLNQPGKTATMALRRGSPAIGKGGQDCPKTDQRGTARKKPCDVGAYETSP